MIPRVQLIRALSLAREEISEGRQWAICLALRDVGVREPFLMPACNYLREFVTIQIQPCSVLSNWCLKKLGLSAFDDAQQAQRAQKMQVTRLTWIDWMIAGLKEELLTDYGSHGYGLD